MKIKQFVQNKSSQIKINTPVCHIFNDNTCRNLKQYNFIEAINRKSNTCKIS